MQVKLTLPHGPWTLAFQQSYNAQLERTFALLNPSAAVPGGGAQSALLVKNSVRNYDTEWTAGPTTGAQTATFAATNKPGTATGAPVAWIPYPLPSGATGYIPVFSA